MARVQRPPIKADIGAETVRLDKPLSAAMATLAEALERTKPEFVDVAVMWLDVIADFRRRDDTALEDRTRTAGVRAAGASGSSSQRAVEYHLSHFVGRP